MRFLLPILGAILVLTGCSTVKTRIHENPPAFYALNAQDQTLVQSGKIRDGLSVEAVYVAWGKADSIRRAVVQGKATETWVYFGTSSYPAHSYNYFPYRSARYRYYSPVYDPVYIPYKYYIKSVTFVGGRVVAWDEPVY